PAAGQQDRPGEAVRRGPGQRRRAVPAARRARARASGIPGRPLPGHDDGAEHTRFAAGQPHARTHLEQYAYRRGGHRLGGIARPGGPGRLLRRRRRAQGHAAEPPAATALPGRDGAADQPRRARPARPQAGVLRSVRPLTDSDVVRRTRRARYLAGRIGGQQVPAYVDEEGVSLRRSTETFAEMELELDNWRWPGTVFRLRTEKALGRDRKEVAVHFRSVPHLPFG